MPDPGKRKQGLISKYFASSKRTRVSTKSSSSSPLAKRQKQQRGAAATYSSFSLSSSSSSSSSSSLATLPANDKRWQSFEPDLRARVSFSQHQAEVARRSLACDAAANGNGSLEQLQQAEKPRSLGQMMKMAKGKKGKGGKPQKEAAKLTPLEQQVVALKQQHPGVVLFVEVGYKFKFFGEDAELAGRLLDIYPHPEKNFLVASIPTYRLNIHLKRIVEAGFKVGVVRQTEKAATKKFRKTSGPFARSLTELYTKATMVEEALAGGISGGGGGRVGRCGDGAWGSKYVLCLREEPSQGKEHRGCVTEAQAVKVSLVAADASNGSVVYDSFSDLFLRQELETRLQQLAPVEILLPCETDGKGDALLSDLTRKVVQRYIQRRSTVVGGGVRMEQLGPAYVSCFDLGAGSAELAQLNSSSSFSSPSSSPSSSSSSSSSPSSSPSFSSSSGASLPTGCIMCLAATLKYLRDFQLDSLVRRDNIHCLASSSTMRLDGPTLRNLEIFNCQSDDSPHGSLLWLLNKTTSAGGGRLLRRWVQKPLLQRAEIEERLDAVEELAGGQAQEEWLVTLRRLLSQVPDLDKGLARAQYRRCQPLEFAQMLRAFRRVAEEVPSPQLLRRCGVQSALLIRTAESFDLEKLQKTVCSFLENLDISATEKGDKANLFSDETAFPKLFAVKEKIKSCERELVELLTSFRRTLGTPYSRIEYKTVSGFEYLLEVKAKDSRKIPSSWAKVSATKVCGRYHPPQVAQRVEMLQRYADELEIAADNAWNKFLDKFNSMYADLRAASNGVAVLDCLQSLAHVANFTGYTRPHFPASSASDSGDSGEDEPLRMIIEGARHPIVEALSSDPFVPNSLSLSQEEGKETFIIVTGPNMGGKSSYMRQMALIQIMAQIGSFVPCDKAELSPIDGVFTRMGAGDSWANGQSTFLVELAETAAILRHATSRSLVILDELGRGTSTHDGVAIASATARYIVEKIGCFTMFTTHYPQIASFARDLAPASSISLASAASAGSTPMASRVGAYYVSFAESETVDDGVSEANIMFLYKLVPGTCPRSYGLNVARLAELPRDVVRRAGVKAAQLREFIMSSQQTRKEAEHKSATDSLFKMLEFTGSSLRNEKNADFRSRSQAVFKNL